MKKSTLPVEQQLDLWDNRVSVIRDAAAAKPELGPPDEAARKMLIIVEKIAGGSRWGKAMESVGWTWKEFSPYSHKNESMKEMLRLIDEMRATHTLRVYEDEAERRAIDGVEEDVFSPHGKKVGKRRVYSDSLLIKLLRARCPEKYGETSQMGGGGGLTLNVDFSGFTRKPDAPPEKKVIDITPEPNEDLT